MNDTKNYMFGLRETLAGRLAGNFLLFLLLFALSCGISFAAVPAFLPDGYFLAVRPVNGGTFFGTVFSVLRCAFPAAGTLTVLWIAAHTSVPQILSGMVILYRGVCLGCAGRLMACGAVVSIGRHWMPALALYFAATVPVLLLAALSQVYSLGFCRTYADRMSRIRHELEREYLHLFLILSGGIFLLSGIGILLL